MEITAYVVDEGRIAPLPVSASEIPAEAVWVDVTEPTVEETRSLAEQLGFHLELDAADLGFEVYGHVEVEGDQLTIVMQADRIDTIEDLSDAKGLILVNTDKLVTFRSGSVPAIEAVARSAQGMEAGPHPQMQIVIQILAKAMQITSRALDAAEAEVHRGARTLFSTAETSRAEVDLENVLSDLGRLQARMVVLRYRHRLISRVVEILRNDAQFAPTAELREDVELAVGDATSLRDFAGSIDEQLSRLMDSTIGFIGLRQNASARWFSIVATLFMPPTLLGAIWGMNFEYMPELDERYAYVLALGLMVLSGTIPLWIVRKMGWLGR
jgi:magnesium transporter